MRPPSTALVPLRALGMGKTRLAHVLDRDHRAVLAEAMFADVVDALAASSVAEVVVVAGNDAAAAAARSRGLEVVTDPAGTDSLDAALTAAVSEIGWREALIVVVADLPSLSGGDVDAVLGTDTPIVVAPTHDGGTAALLRRPSSAIPTAYGPGSAGRHGRLAEAAGLDHGSVHRAGLRRDVDTWADLLDLTATPLGRHTAAILPRLLEATAHAGFTVTRGGAPRHPTRSP